MIEQGLHAYLASVPAVSALLKADGITRIFPLLIPQQALTPCVVYQLTSSTDTQTFCGTIALHRCVVQLDSYARTYPEAVAVARALYDALIDYRGMMGAIEVRNCVREAESDYEDPEPGLYRRYQSWGIWLIQPGASQ